MIKMPSDTWNLSPKHTFTNHESSDDMYDNLPYKRNYDQCNESHIAMESGNIYKFYDCKESRKSCKIPNQDDRFLELVAKHQKAKPEVLDSQPDSQ